MIPRTPVGLGRLFCVLALFGAAPLFSLELITATWTETQAPPVALAAPDTLVLARDTLRLSADVWYNPYGSHPRCGCTATSQPRPVGNVRVTLLGSSSPPVPDTLWVANTTSMWAMPLKGWTGPAGQIRIDDLPPGFPFDAIMLRVVDASGQAHYLRCRPSNSLPV